MKKLGIIIDSFSGLTEEQATKLGFKFLPLQVEIDGKVYEDGVADHLEVLHKLAQAKTFLSSLPKIESIERTVKEAASEFENVLVITLNDSLSSTSRFIRNFAENYSNIHVISNHFSGIQVLNVAKYALRLAESGETVPNIIAQIEKINQDSYTLLVPKNMDYMIKGGRLTGIKKFIMTKITMVPVLAYDVNGQVAPVALKRTLKGAINKCVTKAKEYGETIKNPDFNWMHGIDAEINELVLQDAAANGITLTNEQNTSSVIAIHTGPEAFSITVMPKLD
ncbi:DegV family protein [Mycoplasma hafezii]|uniref:DegV family protein n=1 Tax=Mycoplasma hafezii TaxID=525886 RepID=UPI003CF69907